MFGRLDRDFYSQTKSRAEKRGFLMRKTVWNHFVAAM